MAAAPATLFSEEWYVIDGNRVYDPWQALLDSTSGDAVYRFGCVTVLESA
jgi:hypothetical protein